VDIIAHTLSRCLSPLSLSHGHSIDRGSHFIVDETRIDNIYISYLYLYTYIIYIDAMIVCARNGVGRIRPHHMKWMGRDRERGRQ
jgi:hypothetical protein